MEKHSGKLGVFPSSFNPLTLSHVELIERAASQFDLDEVLLLLDKKTLDKEICEAYLEDRLLMVLIYSQKRPKVSVGLSSHGLFVDKIVALRKLYPQGTKKIFFIVGFDTIIRVLDKKYYDDREKALERLFGSCSFLAANRGVKNVQDIEHLFETEENRKYADRVETFAISDFLASISSTRVRKLVGEGKSIAGLVPSEIEQFISETALYTPAISIGGEKISVYGLRCRAIEHLWALSPEKPAEINLKKIVTVARGDVPLGKEARRVIALPKAEIPERPMLSLPSQIFANFDLVTPLFSPREAQQEARRCLRCDQPPCEGQCLPRLPILELLTLVAQGKLEQAYLRMRQAEPLCGLTEYLCQTKENYCERHCLSRTLFGAGNEVAVQTVLRTLWEYGRGEFEGRFGSGRRDEAMLRSPRQKVAVVGSGPAGLRAATDLAKLGYGVTIFERREQIGGIPRYETPVFRFPAEEVFQQIEKDLQALSIQTVKGVIIGQDMTPDELKSQNFAAVFVATGLTVPKKLNIHGENLKGVLTSIDLFGQFLKVGAEGLMKKFKGRKGYVIDSGNTAMDTSRLLRRLGAEVVCIYWKDKARAYRKEIAAAEREGVSFLFCSLPVELIGDDQGFVSHVRIVKTSFNVNTGDWEPLPGTETDLPADFCIYAIGAKPDFKLEGLSLNDDSHILVNRETLQTSLPTLYAGGDVVERGNISTAIRDGRKAAQSIHRLLRSHTEKP